MHQDDLETTVNDANLRSGGIVPEWEGHSDIWGEKYVLECYIISGAMTTPHQCNFLLPRQSIFVNPIAKNSTLQSKGCQYHRSMNNIGC
jgi:hypothetical protein